MKGRQRAKIILNGTWFVQQTTPSEYIVYHVYYENGRKTVKQKARLGCMREATEYIMDNWYVED